MGISKSSKSGNSFSKGLQNKTIIINKPAKGKDYSTLSVPKKGGKK
jgi:hypothetical protein